MAQVRESSLSDDGGQGVFAIEPLSIGDIVCSGLPLVSLPADRSRCATCWASKGTRKLKRCSGCKYFTYCDKQCQLMHWNNSHKRACNVYKQFDGIQEQRKKLKNLPIAGVLAFELMMFMWISKQPQLHQQFVSNWRQLSEVKKQHCASLASFVMQMWSCFLIEQMENAADDVGDCAQIIWSSEEICELIAKIEQNSFTITDVYLDKCGVGLFGDLFCKFNHSCKPNAQIVFPQLHPDGDEAFEQFGKQTEKGPYAQIRMISGIDSENEILISYLDTADSFRKRQAFLKEEYCFSCKCSRCLKFIETDGNSEEGAKNFACPHEGCPGVLQDSAGNALDCEALDVSAIADGSDFVCSKCHQLISSKHFSEKLEILQQIKSSPQDMLSKNLHVDFLASFLHARSILLYQLSLQLTLAAIDDQDWKVALRWAKISSRSSEAFYQKNSLNTALMKLRVAKLANLLNERKLAVENFTESIIIFKHCFGEDHALVRWIHVTMASIY